MLYAPYPTRDPALCTSRGSTGQFCELPAGHEHGHTSHQGTGASIWFKDYPRWGKDSNGTYRWIQPDEKDYHPHD